MRITEDVYKGFSRSQTHFARSLSISLDSSPPKTSLTHSKPLPQGFFGLDQVYLHLVRVLIPFFHAFHFFLPNFWGLMKNLGFFKIKEVFANFWDGFVFLILKLHALHLICIITMFHAFLDVCLPCCKLVCW